VTEAWRAGARRTGAQRVLRAELAAQHAPVLSRDAQLHGAGGGGRGRGRDCGGGAARVDARRRAAGARQPLAPLRLCAAQMFRVSARLSRARP
jgi:hypothetical protein